MAGKELLIALVHIDTLTDRSGILLSGSDVVVLTIIVHSWDEEVVERRDEVALLRGITVYIFKLYILIKVSVALHITLLAEGITIVFTSH